MDFDSFKKMVQTFGASCARWETNDAEAAAVWAKSGVGTGIIKTEQQLDNKLDLICAPPCGLLADRLYAAVMNEKTQRQIFLFLRYSTWLSLLLMIGGFWLGWYQTQQDYVNTQSYFDTIFDVSY